jgi:hypothetical protein
MKARRRSSLPPFQTKKGRYGTLYHYRIKYQDDFPNPGYPDGSWSTWAYSEEHAEERFYSGDDQGWRVVSIERMREPSGPRY